MIYGAIQCLSEVQAHGRLADTASLHLTDMSAEIKGLRVDVQPSGTYAILSKGGLNATDKANYWIGYYYSSGAYYLKAGFMTSAGVEKSLTYQVTLNIGQWYAVLYTFNNTTKASALYLAIRKSFTNPVSTYTQVATGVHTAATPNASTAMLRIGADTDATGVLANTANISVTEVGVFPQAYAMGDLDSFLSTRFQYTALTASVLYACDEGSGNTLYDRSSSGLNMELVASPPWTDGPPDLFYSTGQVDGPLIGVLSATRRPQTVITSDDEDASYPVTELKVPRCDHVTRTNSATGGKTWIFNFNQPYTIVAISIRNHNFSSKSAVHAELSSSNSWGGPSECSEALTYAPNNYNHIFQRHHQAQWARLTVSDDTNSNGYLSVGTIDWWYCWESSEGIELASKTITIHDPSKLTRTRQGDATLRELDIFTSVQLDFTFIQRDAALEFKRLFNLAVGSAGYVFVCDEPKRNLAHAIYGPIISCATEVPEDAAFQETHLSTLVIAEDKA